MVQGNGNIFGKDDGNGGNEGWAKVSGGVSGRWSVAAGAQLL